MRYSCLIVVGCLLGGAARADDAAPLFPLVLPWDDASPGVTDVSTWGHRPAGKFGPVRAGPDGHLHAGNQRIRFFGVNLCYAATLPRREDAPKVAARMAKFGINAVRFHHMDANPFPGGIRARKAATTCDLDPEGLDRLDYFVDQLKQHGIYANLNLLVSRPFTAADGLPREIEQIADWKDRHVVGFFHAPALEAQKAYARNLLTHRNRYTGLTYAEDPAVAFIEINNENGLIHAWLMGHVDRLPDVFRQDLHRQWNQWLRTRHGSTDALRRAWGVRDEPLGAELLANGNFSQGIERWGLERHGQAKAEAAPGEDLPPALRAAAPSARSARITVTQASTAGWHVQFGQSGISIQAGRPYTLTFWAKADRPGSLSVAVGQDHDPWKDLGLMARAELTTAWKEFRYVFQPDAADAKARVLFGDRGGHKGTVWLAGVSFRPGGILGFRPDERLEGDAMPLFRRPEFGSRTPEGQRDWLRFLWETEANYWQTMRRYLKDELKVCGVVLGTISGCSTPMLMAEFDATDAHAYWQHPEFPGRPWDGENWVVHNRTLVNEPMATLPRLGLRRVLGKPHCVTEYNHSAPNTFGSEGFLLLAAYAALQDWDAVFAFAYSHREDWNTRRISGFFDIDQHPTKMATLPAAVGLFVRGDVRPAEQQVTAAIDKEREVDVLRTGRSWDLVHAGHLGVPEATALRHRVGLVPAGASGATGPRGETGRADNTQYAADTGQLLWDLSSKGRGVVTVNAARSKAVIGYGGGRRFDLGGVVVEPGSSTQDGWSTVTLTAMEGDLGGGAARVLVTATGAAENTGMKWKSAAKDSVGRRWGQAPSLVEGIAARLTLPVPAARLRAWALDERGQRQSALPVQDGGGKASVALGPQWRTLWYELEVAAGAER
jgi:hypothetical protein